MNALSKQRVLSATIALLAPAVICSQAPIYEVAGEDPGEAYAHALAGGGDADGDGRPDFLVGAPRASVGASTWNGRAELRSGSSGARRWSTPGAADGEEFGTAAAWIGDLDGDGSADFLVGGPSTATAAPSSGFAAVLSGASGLSLRITVGGPAPEAYGASVAGPGDVDGDGVPDVLVGAPGAPGAGLTGYARVTSGGTGFPLYTLFGDLPGATFGASVTGVGDWNGDGFPDLAAGGAVGDPNRVRVFSGLGGGVLQEWNFTPCPIPSCLGENPHFGSALDGPGDLNGDGLVELLIGPTPARSTS